MSTTPSTLRERIAALQQRGASPQPASPPRSQTPTGAHSAGSTALRDKIASFEQKGGTPIPRGSFGLGAPPQPTGKRNNELWGNRIPSVGRPLGVGTSTQRAASLSVSSPGRSRRVSMADAQLGGMERLQDPQMLEHIRTGSDMIQSLDIASPTASSPSFTPTSLNSPARRASKANPEALSWHEPVAPPPPPVTPPPIVVIQEEGNDVSGPTSSPPGNAPELDASPISQVELNNDVRNTLTPKASAMTLESLSETTTVDGNGVQSSISVEDDISESSPLSGMEQTFALQPPSLPRQGGSAYESLVGIPENTEQSFTSKSLEVVAEFSSASEDDLLASNEPSPLQCLQEADGPTPLQISVSKLVSPVEANNTSAADEKDSTLEDAVPQISQLTDDAVKSSLLVDTDTKVSQPEGPVAYSEDLSRPKLPSERLENARLTDHLPSTEHTNLTPTAQVPEIVSEILPKVQELQKPEFHGSAAQFADVRSSPRLSTASISASEPSCDSPPRVTPILDAFPAVPRFLPSSSLPTRARTISGRPRDRMSASSTSSTKSTPSLSFSSASSTNSSPTSAVITAPHLPPDSRRPAVGLQRSKSQSRPISSVPSWYDDDSDDGEAGWANVIVTTRRY